jgi:hypothetical protein
MRVSTPVWRTSMLARPPASPENLPPADPGLIPLTVTEIERLVNLVTRSCRPFVTTCTADKRLRVCR